MKYRIIALLTICFSLSLTVVSCKREGGEQKGEVKDTTTQSKGKEMVSNIPADEQNRLTKFMKKRLGARLPSDTNIEVKGYDDSQIVGLKKGKFVVSSTRGSGEVTFLVSDDGRYLIIGEEVSTDGFKDTPVKGLKQGSLMLGGQSIPVIISDDGKQIIMSELFDSTVDPLVEVMGKISLDGVPVKGDEKAKVTIVEYSDFQCPFCKRGSELLPTLLEEYNGKVKIVFKQLPLPIHNWAKDAAIASVCASKQGNDKFWEFHDLVFAKQKEIKAENAKVEFEGIAKQIGLNTGEFDKCLGSPEVEQRVQKEMEEARSIGVSSTPTFVVNGMIVPGANPDGLKSAIEVTLSEK